MVHEGSDLYLVDRCRVELRRNRRERRRLTPGSGRNSNQDCGVSGARGRATSPRVRGGGRSGKPKLMFAVEVELPDEIKTGVSTGRALFGVTVPADDGIKGEWSCNGVRDQSNDKMNDNAQEANQLTPTRLLMEPHQNSSLQHDSDLGGDKSSVMSVGVESGDKKSHPNVAYEGWNIPPEPSERIYLAQVYRRPPG